MRIMTGLACVAAAIGAAAIAPAALGQAAAPAAMGQAAPAIVTHVQTGQELAAVCDPAWGGMPRLEAIAYCQGFLTSFGQYHSLLHPAGGRVRPLFCLPVPGPTIAESGIAFAAWIRTNPGRGAEPALDATLRWAQASFPCPPQAAASPAARNPR